MTSMPLAAAGSTNYTAITISVGSSS